MSIETTDYKRIRAMLNGEKVKPSRHAAAGLRNELFPPQNTPEPIRNSNLPAVTVSGAKRGLSSLVASTTPKFRTVNAPRSNPLQQLQAIMETEAPQNRKGSTEEPQQEGVKKNGAEKEIGEATKERKRSLAEPQQENMENPPKRKDPRLA